MKVSLVAELCSETKPKLENTSADDRSLLLLSEHGAEPQNDKVKVVWCVQVNLLFDGMRQSDVPWSSSGSKNEVANRPAEEQAAGKSKQ